MSKMHMEEEILWNPVTESLPELYKKVLVATSAGKVFISERHPGNPELAPTNPEDWSWKNKYGDKIVAWMYLPRYKVPQSNEQPF